MIMTLRRCDSLPSRLRVAPVPANTDPNSPLTKNVLDSNTNPDFQEKPLRDEVIAAWKSLQTDVKKIKNGFLATHEPDVFQKASKTEVIAQKFYPASGSNRDVRKRIRYDTQVIGNDHRPLCVLDSSNVGRVELGTCSQQRRTLIQRLLFWKVLECDCQKSNVSRLRSEDFCVCGATRVNFSNRNNKCAERGRSKSVGYEVTKEVTQFRRCASAGASVGVETAAALRARAALTLYRRYYPEGGWGWTITIVSTIVQVLAHGLQLGGGTGPIACAAATKYNVSPLYTHGVTHGLKFFAMNILCFHLLKSMEKAIERLLLVIVVGVLLPFLTN